MSLKSFKRRIAKELGRCSKKVKLDTSVAGTSTIRRISKQFKSTSINSHTTTLKSEELSPPPLAPLPLSREVDTSDAPDPEQEVRPTVDSNGKETQVCIYLCILCLFLIWIY